MVLAGAGDTIEDWGLWHFSVEVTCAAARDGRNQFGAVYMMVPRQLEMD